MDENNMNKIEQEILNAENTVKALSGEEITNEPEEKEEISESETETKPRRELPSQWLGILSMIISITIGLTISITLAVYKRIYPNPSEKLTSINELVREYYSGDIDETVLEDAIANAYMESIGDKYSFYCNAEESKEVENSLDGNASGIGVTVFNDTENKALKVFRIDSGSPADKAGLQIGDSIIAVDGKTVEEVGFSESVNSIIREIGQKVKITLLRDGKTLDVEITFEEFVRQSVYFETVEDYGYICITAFNEATARQFETAYKTLTEQKVKGLIFDVRDNGGGTVDSVCEILDTLVGECDLITIEYNDGSKEVSARSDANKCELPMVVLTNGRTASASELFSANLRNMENALLIGNNTYGKGVVQRTYFLSDGSCIRFTVGEFLPAGGEGFNEKGLAPDFEVNFTEEQEKNKYLLGDDDPYLQKAVEQLNGLTAEGN